MNAALSCSSGLQHSHLIEIHAFCNIAFLQDMESARELTYSQSLPPCLPSFACSMEARGAAELLDLVCASSTPGIRGVYGDSPPRQNTEDTNRHGKQMTITYANNVN